jgi:hypothetical protein
MTEEKEGPIGALEGVKHCVIQAPSGESCIRVLLGAFICGMFQRLQRSVPPATMALPPSRWMRVLEELNVSISMSAIGRTALPTGGLRGVGEAKTGSTGWTRPHVASPHQTRSNSSTTLDAASALPGDTSTECFFGPSSNLSLPQAKWPLPSSESFRMPAVDPQRQAHRAAWKSQLTPTLLRLRETRNGSLLALHAIGGNYFSVAHCTEPNEIDPSCRLPDFDQQHISRLSSSSSLTEWTRGKFPFFPGDTAIDEIGTSRANPTQRSLRISNARDTAWGCLSLALRPAVSPSGGCAFARRPGPPSSAGLLPASKCVMWGELPNGRHGALLPPTLFARNRSTPPFCRHPAPPSDNNVTPQCLGWLTLDGCNGLWEPMD